MNTKSKVLIGLMAICLLGGVGSALALTQTGANAAGQPGAFDKAVYLYWGSDASSVTLNNVEDLQINTPVYRYLEVSPKSTKTVAGNVQLTFTLSALDGHHIKGLSVSIYKTASLATDETVASLIDGVTPTPVLNESNLSGIDNVAIVAGEAAHETKAYYAIAVEWTGANDPENEALTMAGNVTIAQAFLTA